MPEIIGTGHIYNCSIVAVWVKSNNDSFESEETKGTFMTKPLAPTKLAVSARENHKPLEICWVKSMTPNVSKYKIRWKSMNEANEEIKTDEHTIKTKSEETQLYYSFPEDRVNIGTSYKVNVYAIVEFENQSLIAESKELHAKFFIKSSNELALHNEEQEQKQS